MPSTDGLRMTAEVWDQHHILGFRIEFDRAGFVDVDDSHSIDIEHYLQSKVLEIANEVSDIINTNVIEDVEYTNKEQE